MPIASLAYLGEFHSDKTRAKAVTFAAVGYSAANIHTPIIGLIILPMKWKISIAGFLQYTPWRLDIFIVSSLLLILFVVLIFLPETPKYLMAMGKEKEALDSLRFAYRTNTGKTKNVCDKC